MAKTRRKNGSVDKRQWAKKYVYKINSTSDAWDVLRQRGKTLGLTDGDMAALVEVSPATTVNWNRRMRNPSLDNIEKLCERIGADLEISIKVRQPPKIVMDLVKAKDREKEAKRRTRAYKDSLKWRDETQKVIDQNKGETTQESDGGASSYGTS